MNRLFGHQRSGTADTPMEIGSRPDNDKNAEWKTALDVMLSHVGHIPEKTLKSVLGGYSFMSLIRHRLTVLRPPSTAIIRPGYALDNAHYPPPLTNMAF